MAFGLGFALQTESRILVPWEFAFGQYGPVDRHTMRGPLSVRASPVV